MKKRPLAVTLISVLYVVAGTVGLAYHAREMISPMPFRTDEIWVLLVRLLAVFCGVFLFRGANWARWLAIAWMAFHVGVSALHSVSQTFVHALFLAVIAWLLFRHSSSVFFDASGSGSGSAGDNSAT